MKHSSPTKCTKCYSLYVIFRGLWRLLSNKLLLVTTVTFKMVILLPKRKKCCCVTISQATQENVNRRTKRWNCCINQNEDAVAAIRNVLLMEFVVIKFIFLVYQIRNTTLKKSEKLRNSILLLRKARAFSFTSKA